MKISLRLKIGWQYKVKNKSKETCDIDGAKLWIAPHGGIYCDKVHEPTDGTGGDKHDN